MSDSCSLSPRSSSDSRFPLWARCVTTSVLGLATWVPCEVLGGLLFLGLGVRLWAYHIAPLFWQLTSLVVWAILLPILGAHVAVYLIWERRAGINGPQRWLYRSLFLMVAGPINEVVWNSLIWSLAGKPLYLYTVLPTFDGSGSLLSPLYYLTLLVGFWVDEKVPWTVGYRDRSAIRLTPRPPA